MENMNREQWLTTASDIIRTTIIDPVITRLNCGIDADAVKVAVSIGHPKSKRAIGECWKKEASEDKETAQIFITPHNNDSVRILDVLTHELVHAYDNNESGHRGRFAKIARAVDLQGKLTATVAGDKLKEQLLDIVDALGDIPHTKLDASKSGRPRQTARMLKVECSACGFLFRASRTQIERLDSAAPCPCCGQESMLHIS